MAGASVSIQWAAFPSHEAALLPPEEMRPPTVTDAEGCFHLASVPAQCRVSLKVDHPRYAATAALDEPARKAIVGSFIDPEVADADLRHVRDGAP